MTITPGTPDDWTDTVEPKRAEAFVEYFSRIPHFGLAAPESARPATLTPEQPVKAPVEDENSQRPSEPVLPRPIEPEDVRVGMVVEQRKGESLLRGRVIAIEGGTIECEVAWLHTEDERDGWSLWLVEDAPEPVDPDAADRQCAWADYRKDYGVGESEMEAAHKAFMAGWKSAREGDQSGPLR